jgi:hypothetical protein
MLSMQTLSRAYMPNTPAIDPGRPAQTSKSKIKLKGTALPTEHGAWGMVSEPIVTAIAVAFSLGGIFVAIAFIGAFLMRQPLKVLLIERASGRHMPQGDVARRYIVLYTVIFAAGASAAAVWVPITAFWPLLIAAPLAAIQAYFDSERQSRRLAPELAGAVAISSSAAVIALAGGWAPASAAALWVIFVCRGVPSIFYVRERLLLEKGKPFRYVQPVLFSAGAAIAAVALAGLGLSPWLGAAMMIVLFIRAAVGLSDYRKPRKAMQIGVFEVVFGAVTVLALIVGYLLHI